MKNLVSIIVPVFNTEKYLRRCVESLLNQDYKNIEILLIDDGSSDKSGEICEEYSKNFSFVKTFHKTNGGASSARNIGLSQIKGEFFCFVDSDDFVEKDYISCMVLAIKETDIVFTQIEKNSLNGVFDKDFILNKFIYHNDGIYHFRASAALFKSEKFKNFRFDNNVFVGEDFDFSIRATLKSQKITLLNKVKYHYCSSDTSVMRSAFNKKKFESQIYAIDNFIDYCKNFYPKYLNLAYFYKVDTLFAMYYRSRNIDKNLSLKYIKDISKLSYKIYKNPKLSIKYKIIVFLYSNFHFIIKRLKK